MAGSEYSYPSPQALLPPGISWSPSVDCLSLPLLTPLPSLPNYSPIDIRLMLMLMLTLIVYPSHANFSSLPIIPSASGNSYSISIMKQLQPHQLWCNFVVDHPYMYMFIDIIHILVMDINPFKNMFMNIHCLCLFIFFAGEFQKELNKNISNELIIVK